MYEHMREGGIYIRKTTRQQKILEEEVCGEQEIDAHRRHFSFKPRIVRLCLC